MTSNMASNEDEMAEFQARSDDWRPDVQGLVPVGRRQSTAALIGEYANAEPIFVAKTNSLARTHPQYRVIVGDGKCGWRALAVGYFETLINLHDATKIQQETARFQAINVSGEDTTRDMLEMFSESWLELLDQLKNAVNDGTPDDSVVAAKFNDEEHADALIFYLKMITKETMMANFAHYQNYCEDQLIQYIDSNILPMPPYIDQLGLQAAADALLSPAGFALEILYLDLSHAANNECNRHQIVEGDAGCPKISLLYRPGHYDIIYEVPPTAAYSGVPPMQSVQVHIAHQIPDHHPFYVSDGTVHDMYSITDFLPNYSIVGGMPQTGPQQMVPDSVLYGSEGFAGDIYHTGFPPSEATSTHTSLPVSPVSPQDGPQVPQLAIRLSRLTHEPMQTIPLQTAPFKNSQYNQAHYQNTEFQPAMWNADEEYHKP